MIMNYIKMKIILILLIMAVCMACSIVQGVRSDGRALTMLYKIKKIKEEKLFYIVYAIRNDSVFKIISFIDSTSISNCEKIKIRSFYFLDLEKIFPLDSLFGKSVAPNLGIKGFKVNNEKIIMLESKTHNRIYTALNLNGLCIKY